MWLVYRTLKGIFSVKKEQGSVNEQISEMVQDPSCLTFIPKNRCQKAGDQRQDLLFLQ